ncbi:MAG: SDR family oxidoreductase [Deltaproteobacteria bacterium]|nr:SDR family oxidoreductase [Deltaproteobacteria bacterium]MCL5277719.1 SDR family oxidoreductase [Deltaproteobacteria bacterium]
MNRRVVITGGAGFIGSHLCEYFLGKSYDVLCVDNLLTGSMDNISHLSGVKGFVFMNHDITNDLQVPGRVDYVLNFASPASPVDYLEHPIETLKVGSFGTHTSIGLAKEKGARYFLASTSEVYGDPLVNPQPETYWGNVNSVGPRSVYDEAKRFAEAMTIGYHRFHKVDVRIVRIFNTYGPRMRLNDGRVVPNFVMQALHNEPLTVYGDGSQTRSFCYVSDLVEGIYRLLVSDYVGPVNLGNPEEWKIIDFARHIIALSGSRSTIAYKPLPQDDPKQRRPDIALAKRLLAWEPKVGLDEGLRKTMGHFLKQR